jgi:hypothetical protein
MCLPLTAEGEFAQVMKHLQAIGRKPVLMLGFLVTDTILNFMRADLAVLQRDETALRQYATLAAETAARDGHVLFQAGAQRALGVMYRLAGEHAQAADRLEHALELFQGLDTRWQIGRTLFELAELAVSRSDLGLARDCFRRALAAFETMGAGPDAERTRAALASLC